MKHKRFTSPDELIRSFHKVRILVVGDVMLDRYWSGSVSRISPEAPIPVVEVTERSGMIGGAGNVANNIASLGAKVHLVGIVGQDAEAREIKDLFRSQGLSTAGLISDPSRPTTTKTRVMGHHQHMVRVDHESTRRISGNVETRVLAKIRSLLPGCQAVILEDYNKGVFTSRVISETIRMARTKKIPVTVDPKFDSFFDFKGVTVFKPNIKEIQGALGRPVTDRNIGTVCRDLIKKMRLENVVITLGEKGMVFASRNGRGISRIPTVARKVYDVSGAGDAVIAALTLCLACGQDLHTAALVANHAAGGVCQEVGVVPATPEMISGSLTEMP